MERHREITLHDHVVWLVGLAFEGGANWRRESVAHLQRFGELHEMAGGHLKVAATF